MTTAHENKDEDLFENRTEDEDLAPYEDEKKKNKDVQREKEERERREHRPDA
jgi:hypothetical protein